MDVKTAYLHSPIEEEIYINALEGYQTSNPNLVWKSLYGLRQSGRNWNDTFHNNLKDNGFAESIADPCMLTKSIDSTTIYLYGLTISFLHLAIILDRMADTKSHLSQTLKMKDIGQMKHFLGIDFSRTGSQISMSQEEYILKIRERRR